MEYLNSLSPEQRILAYVVIGLIWAYITYKACVYVIKREEEKEEYNKKHTPPFVITREQNGKQLRKR